MYIHFLGTSLLHIFRKFEIHIRIFLKIKIFGGKFGFSKFLFQKFETAAHSFLHLLLFTGWLYL